VKKVPSAALDPEWTLFKTKRAACAAVSKRAVAACPDSGLLELEKHFVAENFVVRDENGWAVKLSNVGKLVMRYHPMQPSDIKLNHTYMTRIGGTHTSHVAVKVISSSQSLGCELEYTCVRADGATALVYKRAAGDLCTAQQLEQCK